MQKLKLETGYTINGNSSGTPLDTLAIAVIGDDYNGTEEYNWDYIAEQESYAKQYWLDNDAEDFFRKSLAKEQLLAYAEDLEAYDAALSEYKETFADVQNGDYEYGNEAQESLARDIEKAADAVREELYHDWLHGDYRGNFTGVLPAARKKYSIEFSEEKGEVFADITPEFIEELKENGYIERKSVKAAREWLENDIDGDARITYRKKQEENAKRREEREKTREYQKRQAEAAIERKKQTLRELAANK